MGEALIDYLLRSAAAPDASLDGLGQRQLRVKVIHGGGIGLHMWLKSESPVAESILWCPAR